MPESDDNLRLEIRHVLFIDIVGYSKLLNEEQKERLNQLTEIVLATTPVRDTSTNPSGSIKLIKLSIFSVAPVISKMKLSMPASST